MEKMKRLGSLPSADLGRSGASVFYPTEKKRKGYPKEERPFYTAAIDYKRFRESDGREKSEPLSLGRALEDARKGGRSASPGSSCQTRGDEEQTKTGRTFHFDPNETGSLVSAYGTGASNISTLTLASSEDGERVLPASFSHRPNSSNGYVSSRKASVGHFADRRGRKSKNRAYRDRRKDGAADCAQSEVVSNDSTTALSAFPRSWADPQFIPSFSSKGASIGSLTRETGATYPSESGCSTDLGCSTVNRAESDGWKDALGLSFLKSSGPTSSSCLQSTSCQGQRCSSVLTDWGSPSRQSSPFLRKAHCKGHTSNEPPLSKISNDVLPEILSAGEGLTENGCAGTVTSVGKDEGAEHESSSATSTSSGSGERLKLQQNREDQPSTPKDDESKKDCGPTFVLSSGRLSQEEEKKIGRRPPTIDDDFEKYFSQLVL